MTLAEILPELWTCTRAAARPSVGSLFPADLKNMMDVRVSFGRYFEPCDEGRYARRAG